MSPFLARGILTDTPTHAGLHALAFHFFVQVLSTIWKELTLIRVSLASLIIRPLTAIL
jgi:hypothetical protein